MTDGTWAEGVEKFQQMRAVKRLAANALIEERREHDRQSGRCLVCRQPITIMINRGTGWCSENCRKALAGE